MYFIIGLEPRIKNWNWEKQDTKLGEWWHHGNAGLITEKENNMVKKNNKDGNDKGGTLEQWKARLI